MIKGNKVYLRAIEKEDLVSLMSWRNIPEYRKYFREYREISTDMQENWYKNKVLNDPSTIMFSICLNANDQLIGCCGLCYINFVNRHADLSLYMGLENVYIDDKGYAEESCKLLFNYGFNEMGLNKIWTEIYEFDKLKYNLYHNLGFHDDGILREQYYHEGIWWNSYMMSLLKREFKN